MKGLLVREEGMEGIWGKQKELQNFGLVMIYNMNINELLLYFKKENMRKMYLIFRH